MRYWLMPIRLAASRSMLVARMARPMMVFCMNQWMAQAVTMAVRKP
ncbi:MAG: hypothetical protein ACD_75C02330G0002 [uncultured bacterium]|nr:MAG: hypothetical protein ACD_75C02330G0002 [uncultured bacterium]